MELALNAHLGRTHDAQLIGYTILTAQRNPVRPWTREGVVRTAPGWWAVQGLIEVGNAGGFIQWGLKGEPPIAESSFDPVPIDNASLILKRLDSTIATLTRQTGNAVTDLGRLMAGELAEIRAAVEQLSDTETGILSAWAAQKAVEELKEFKAKVADALVTVSAPVEVRPRAAVGETVKEGITITAEKKAKFLESLDRIAAIYENRTQEGQR